MKKIIYYLCFLIILFLISIIPTSAKEIKTCVRTDTDLRVRESLITGKNYSDIMSTPCVDESEKVYDFANLLTDLEEEQLYQEVLNYIEITNYDLVIVTTNDNNKEDEVAYADDFYDYNSFGNGDTRDGVLLLIDMSNRRVYISTTGYAIVMYNSRIDDIIDAGYDYLTSQDYYNTFSKMIDKMSYYYNLGVDEKDSNTIVIDESGRASYIRYIPYRFIGIISGIVTLIVSIIVYNRSKLKIKVGSTISYLKEKNITKKEDNLVNTIVTHTLRYNDTSSGGGSSGGGSFHSSSSGSSHGGGGRSF